MAKHITNYEPLALKQKQIQALNQAIVDKKGVYMGSIGDCDHYDTTAYKDIENFIDVNFPGLTTEQKQQSLYQLLSAGKFVLERGVTHIKAPNALAVIRGKCNETMPDTFLKTVDTLLSTVLSRKERG